MPRLSTGEQGLAGRRCSQSLHPSIVAIDGPDYQSRFLELLRNLRNRRGPYVLGGRKLPERDATGVHHHCERRGFRAGKLGFLVRGPQATDEPHARQDQAFRYFAGFTITHGI
jgi:hypothetical protein